MHWLQSVLILLTISRWIAHTYTSTLVVGSLLDSQSLYFRMVNCSFAAECQSFCPNKDGAVTKPPLNNWRTALYQQKNLAEMLGINQPNSWAKLPVCWPFCEVHPLWSEYISVRVECSWFKCFFWYYKIFSLGLGDILHGSWGAIRCISCSDCNERQVTFVRAALLDVIQLIMSIVSWSWFLCMAESIWK